MEPELYKTIEILIEWKNIIIKEINEVLDLYIKAKLINNIEDIDNKIKVYYINIHKKIINKFSFNFDENELF